MRQKKLEKIDRRIKNNGFTLLEVLMAMAIFLIGILAVGSMQIAAVEDNASARKRTEAATWAADQAENLMSLPYVNILDGGPVIEGAYTIRWDVDENVPLTNTKTITVRVTWNDRGSRSYSVDFMKRRPI